MTVALPISHPGRVSWSSVGMPDLGGFEGNGYPSATRVNPMNSSLKYIITRQPFLAAMRFSLSICVISFFLCFRVCSWAQAPPVFTKSFQSSVQTIPLIMDHPANEKKTLGWLKLRCDPVAESNDSNEGPQLQFDPKSKVLSQIHSGLNCGFQHWPHR